MKTQNNKFKVIKKDNWFYLINKEGYLVFPFDSEDPMSYKNSKDLLNDYNKNSNMFVIKGYKL